MANSKFKIDPEFVPIPSFHTVKEAKKSDWQILFESILVYLSILLNVSLLILNYF
jgi:hypothetical protein